MMHPFTYQQILATLVSFDTTSRNSNLELIAFIEDYLNHYGVPYNLIEYSAGKTNLFATIGPQISGGVILSGHTDVVPVDGQAWRHHPFTLQEEQGKLYGRGTCDMKGFLAVMLAMVPQFQRQPLAYPVHLAFSCDEEVGCRGVRPLLAWLGQQPYKPAAAIIGEPTQMQLVNAHKSANAYRTEVKGLVAHSSLVHQGVNAILVAGQLLAKMEDLRQFMAQNSERNEKFDPPHASLSVGTIQGGIARNIIPDFCEFFWETRFLPGGNDKIIPQKLRQRADELEIDMKKISPTAEIIIEQTNAAPALAPEINSPAEQLVRSLTGANTASAVSYCTEAGLFQQAGIPAVICGPGSIEQAHKPDEFIEISELEQCQAFMARLCQRLQNHQPLAAV